MEEKKNNALEKAEKAQINRANKQEKKRAKKLKAERIREERAKLKAERENQKLMAEAERARTRQAHKNDKKFSGKGGWLAAVITLSIATLLLASTLTFTYLMPSATDTALESNYRKSFYDTVEQIDNIDLNLSKILASKDKGAIQTYLLDVAVESELAENDLQQLPLRDENKFYTTKLVNQIGDYAKYLNKKLINGEDLSNEDLENLRALYKANKVFKDSLNSTITDMGVDYSFSSLNNAGKGNLVLKNFNELENLSVDYPELIYDGPFSDGQDEREVKGITGNALSQVEAQEVFKKIFKDRGLEEVNSTGESEGNIPTYNFTAMEKGDELYAQISKTGGRLVMFAYSGSCKEVNYQSDFAVEKGLEFLNACGYENMKAVWINLSNNLYTINFAYTQNNVIIYSDLVKVRVCAETGSVIGLEATSYLMNHTERVINSPAITKSMAVKFVSDEIEVETGRLVVVPIGSTNEKLCYEFSGNYDGSIYYVYIDAISGRQVEMFKVIESTEGELLM